MRHSGSGGGATATGGAPPLPTGASTSANQNSEISSLTSLDGKTPALGQALAAASVPIVLTAIQLAALTPLSSVGVNNFPATQPISAVALPLPSGAATASLQTTGNTSVASIDTKTPALGQALAAASVPVVLTAAQIATLTPLTSVGVNNFPATQPISAVALPLPSGAATSGNQATEIASLASIDGKLRSQTASLTASSPTAASVTTSSGAAVAANASRKGLILTNTSTTEKISFGIGAAAVLNSGITLTPYGVWVMDAYTFTTAAINAIASAAANLAIQELT